MSLSPLNYHKQANTPQICKELIDRITSTLQGEPMTFMEVCGTHTMALFHTGIRSLLPANIRHVSGPGCPVCVTHESEAALFLELAKNRDILLTSYGDLARIPGPDGMTLKKAQAQGGNIQIVYSALDALELAKKNPAQETVFISVGFETTAPGMAAAILKAKRENINNFSILNFHKLTPPVLKALADDPQLQIDAFLLPGHVATITGLSPFEFLVKDYAYPAVAGGFEAADLLLALYELAKQHKKRSPEIHNAYPRAVKENGNPVAMKILASVFEKTDALWRGLGKIPDSGLKLKEAFSGFDAIEKFNLKMPEAVAIKGCQCGNILKGLSRPDQCALFGKRCTPANPVGPCMVSSEGSCAAYFQYGMN